MIPAFRQLFFANISPYLSRLPRIAFPEVRDMLERFASGLWSPWLLGLFFVVGLWCSALTGFFQIFGAKTWLRAVLGGLSRSKAADPGRALTRRQALATALGSTIGTGSIAGVSTALFFGGPGAVFWMWLSAFLGLMLSFTEKALAVKYRRRAPSGGWEGGPMEYLRALGWRGWAKWWSAWCVLASLAGGAMVQANSIASALGSTLGWEALPVGAVTAVLTGAVILGGVVRVGKVSERLVPLMAGLFLTVGVLVIAAHADRLVPALELIFTCALTPRSAAGGAAGYALSSALRYGVARGVFTNEAGVGSSAMAHAAADAVSPADQGFLGMFETGFATLVVCSITALSLLTSGVYDPAAALDALHAGAVTGQMAGSALVCSAFATVFGTWGEAVVTLCLLLFAFTSLLGWSYYGERGLASLTGTDRLRRPFQVLFLVCILLGSVGDLSDVWALSDIGNGLMALPNLFALAVLLPEARAELKKERRC